MKVRKLLLVLVALFATVAIVTPASAATTVVRPFPNGIDGKNPQKAWQQVKNRASVDLSYARAIATAAGDTSFSASDYKVEGYGKVSSGTNSATVTTTGQTIGVRDTVVCRVKAKAFIIRHKVTGKAVEICVGCGNVRLKKGTPTRPVKWSKGTVLPFKKVATINRKIECPDSGMVIPVTVKITVQGKTKARTWGKAWGKLQAKIKQEIDFKIKGEISAKCPQVSQPEPAPEPKPPMPRPPVPPVIVGPCSNVIIGGNNNNQEGNCNQIPPPCEKGCVPPPPPEQPKIPAPIAETPGLAHTYVKGNADLFLKVKPAPGRDVAVQANVTAGGGTVSGVQSSSTYADEACPAEWKCYRAKFWAPNSPGKSRVTFTVNQDDGQTTEVVTEISIVPDEF